jgi:hypothetical protein
LAYGPRYVHRCNGCLSLLAGKEHSSTNEIDAIVHHLAPVLISRSGAPNVCCHFAPPTAHCGWEHFAINAQPVFKQFGVVFGLLYALGKDGVGD